MSQPTTNMSYLLYEFKKIITENEPDCTSYKKNNYQQRIRLYELQNKQLPTTYQTVRCWIKYATHSKYLCNWNNFMDW